MLAASFPNFGVAGLAWIAPGLILSLAIGKPGKQAFRIGYVAGIVHYLASLSWLLLIPVPLAWAWTKVLGWGALAAFIALYPAIWVWLTWKMFPAKITTDNSLTPIQHYAEQFHSVPWSRRLIWTISGAALWVALEMMVARFLGGFPWNLLGDSQFRMTPIIQVTAYTGVYGISFLLVWTSLSLLGAAMVIIRRPAMRSAWVGEIILPMLTVATLYATGYHKLMRPEPELPTMTVAMIQPSIPQSLIWDTNANALRFKQLLQLSEQALTHKPDLLLWPEAAVPKMVAWDEETYQAVSNLAQSHKVWMIIGSDDLELHTNATKWSDSDAFNSSFLVSPEGKLVQRYKKRNLVIFGEYIPLVHILPFMKYLTPIGGGFTPGDRVIPFGMTDLKANVSVLICYEDVFPHLAREYVFDDTDFLVNLTNNGWFGEGSAQWQHAAAALFRAVENGIPLVRCSNNGLTCWIDSCGRLRQVFKSDSDGIYGPGYMIARVPVLAPGEKRLPTYYRLHGDRFGWGCIAFVVLQLLRTWSSNRKPRNTSPSATPAHSNS
ncbi:MAG: Apolipoprotein N-acyltransferase [Pedosphaera sp.]|nr:Apolipoprotein N-acyltransferase [Pedosphaera sp.]